MANQDILANLDKYKFYHRIELPGGIVTPDHRAGEPQQDLVRRSLNSVGVKGKRVLDVGCRDGLFCFEAERRGASDVIGIDNELSHGATEFLIPHLKSEVKMYEMNVIDLTSDTLENSISSFVRAYSTTFAIHSWRFAPFGKPIRRNLGDILQPPRAPFLLAVIWLRDCFHEFSSGPEGQIDQRDDYKAYVFGLRRCGSEGLSPIGARVAGPLRH